MLTKIKTTVAALSLCLLTTFLIFSSHTDDEVIVSAEPKTFTTNLGNGTWHDYQGNLSNGRNYEVAPFTIIDREHSFLFSSGYLHEGITPRLGSHNATAANYHNFNHPALAQFRHLSSWKSTVFVINKSLINTRVTNITFSMTNTVNGHQYIDLIYSLNDGLTWQHYQDMTGYTYTDGLTISFDCSMVGNRLLFGVLTRYNAITYRYLVDPVLTFTYEALTVEQEAHTFANLIGTYTPCESDTDGLTLVDSFVANNLLEQYQTMSLPARIIFDEMVISQDVTYLDRLIFIINKHSIIHDVRVNKTIIDHKNNDATLYLLPLLMVGIFVYVVAKRK